MEKKTFLGPSRIKQLLPGGTAVYCDVEQTVTPRSRKELALRARGYGGNPPPPPVFEALMEAAARTELQSVLTADLFFKDPARYELLSAARRAALPINVMLKCAMVNGPSNNSWALLIHDDPCQAVFKYTYWHEDYYTFCDACPDRYGRAVIDHASKRIIAYAVKNSDCPYDMWRLNGNEYNDNFEDCDKVVPVIGTLVSLFFGPEWACDIGYGAFRAHTTPYEDVAEQPIEEYSDYAEIEKISDVTQKHAGARHPCNCILVGEWQGSSTSSRLHARMSSLPRPSSSSSESSMDLRG